jgi:hypothetical protein
MMLGIVKWLESTALHQFFLDHYGTFLPVIQAIHVLGVGVVVVSIFMIVLRILNRAGRDLTLTETVGRYRPWIWGGLVLLLATGMLMIFTEPGREFLDPGQPSSPEKEYWNWAFWIKMGLLLIGIAVAATFQSSLRRNQERWEKSLAVQTRIRALAVLTLIGWLVILILGRLIAYPGVLYGAA